MVVVYGPRGSGKTTLIDALVSDSDFEASGGLHKVRHITTRDYRQGEVPGTDVVSVSLPEFKAMSKNNELVSDVTIQEASGEYRNGTAYADLDTQGTTIIDMNPEGVANLEAKAKEKGWELFKIFLYAKSFSRMQRIAERRLDLIPTEQLTAFHSMVAEIGAMQKMSKDTNPQQPYDEREADLVIENPEGKLEEVVKVVKEGVLGFLQREGSQEMHMELRKNNRG